MPAVLQTIDRVQRIDVDQYKYGFETDIESVKAPKGLNEGTVRFISDRKAEPAWMLELRLDAFRRWKMMTEPTWANVRYPKIDFQNLYYYAAPKSTEGPKSLADVDPALLRTYEKLGIPLREREILAGVQNGTRVAVDAVFDSVSVVTTFKEELGKAGVIAAKLHCNGSESRTRNERVQVAVDFGLVVPVGMIVVIERDLPCQDVDQVIFPAVAAFVSSDAVEHRPVRGFL